METRRWILDRMTLHARIHLLLSGIALLGCASAPPGEQEAATTPREVRVWTTRALATVLAEVGPEFERTSGSRLRVVSDLPPGFARRAAAGESFDLLISGSATVDEWVRAGRVDAATRTDLARSGIGVAVRAGTPKPDLRTVETFRRALLGAKSIAYLRVGSGIYLDSLFERLDLAGPLAAKARRPEGDSVATLVAQGQVELGLVVITQIVTTPGVELAGPLPPEIQSYVTFAAALSSRADSPEVARQLIEFLRGPAAARVIVAQGMQRPPF
jgi:molybdate transport system substrate-binding protein